VAEEFLTFHYDCPELCKARCFPPVALVWDPPFGLEVIPNLDSEIVVVDSAPAIWGSSYGSEHTTIVLLVRANHFLIYCYCKFLLILVGEYANVFLIYDFFKNTRVGDNGRERLFGGFASHYELYGNRLQVDPHCSYKASLDVSLPTAASRFLLVYGLQVLAPLMLYDAAVVLYGVQEVPKSSLG
jgi:hypothetical protein